MFTRIEKQNASLNLIKSVAYWQIHALIRNQRWVPTTKCSPMFEVRIDLLSNNKLILDANLTSINLYLKITIYTYVIAFFIRDVKRLLVNHC